MAPRQKNCVDDSRKREKATFKKMFPGFKKKASELSVLCGNSVGFICYGPGGDEDDLYVWPEPQDNPQALPRLISEFNKQSNLKRQRYATQLTDDFQYLLEGLSVEELTNHLADINSQLVGIRQKKLEILIKTVPEEDGRPRVSVSENVSVSGKEVDLALGFPGGDYFPAEDPMAVKGFCGDDCIWDSSQLDLEFFGFKTQPLCGQ
ncbi:hypothetical protein EUTSA_v10023980mg [Eutrema salsugineum]|uniref:MADS-box domain-containing protein n=1 Tax=Eutrema salsugineum TaxID=72664 RepID=V4KI34_EUTSA|nr:agamous-like MADS-box protein AGL49 [Eutrema salsugineum]ESQ29522.1 hypothetical protein EUTSA_v10023980mg [Eutrema salsugineum]